MRVMTKLCMGHPACCDVRLRNLRQRPSPGVERVAFLAGLAQEQVLRLIYAEPDPLSRVPRNSNRRGFFGNLTIESYGFVNFAGMRGDVFSKSFLKKYMDDIRLVVRNLFLAEALIEIQQVTRGAIFREFRRNHIRRMLRGSHS